MMTASECPYAYYLLKFIGVEPVENAFAEAGNLAHELLAGWAKNEISIKELPGQWIQRFPKEVTAAFPAFLAAKGYREKLYFSILNYFENFNGFPEYEVVGAEKEFQSSIGGQKYIGIVDLILWNKETGKLMLVDHKSTSLSSFKRNREAMYRQLLLYSKYCADEYGEFPDTLRFNLFKENLYDERPFEQKSYIAAKQWAEATINDMKSKDFMDWMEVRPELFRCVNLCNCRNQCCFGLAENHKRKDDILGKKQSSDVA